MVSGKRIYSDFKVFSRGYLRNKFGLFFGLIFPVILDLDFRSNLRRRKHWKSKCIRSKPRHRTIPNRTKPRHRLLRSINKSSTITVITVDPSENFSKYLADHSASDGILIPQNFTLDYAIEPASKRYSLW